jgi:hypothetical protein
MQFKILHPFLMSLVFFYALASGEVTCLPIEQVVRDSVAHDKIAVGCDAHYRSNGTFWPVDLRRKSASLRLVGMRSDTILRRQQLRC